MRGCECDQCARVQSKEKAFDLHERGGRMNERNNDRFESLISAAVVDCVYQAADELCAADTSAVPDTSRLRKRVMRNLRNNKRTTVKTIIAVALIAAMLALTACACVQKIREYVWGVVTEWYGDHFEVSFEQEFATTEELQTTAPEVELPTEIEQVAKLTYLPEGNYLDNEISFSSQHISKYCFNNEWTFIFVQSTYDATNSFMNGENIDSVCVQVKNCKAMLTEKAEEEGVMYCLFWQDDQYRYCLQGYFSSVTVLIQTAESISFE